MTRCCASNWKSLRAEGFDLDITGFDADALAELIAVTSRTTRGRPMKTRYRRFSEIPISRPGDVWIMGQHRLRCGALPRWPSSYDAADESAGGRDGLHRPAV